MKYAFHGICSLHSNIMSDIRVARDAGYQGLEIHTEKLWRYINAGFQPKDLKRALDKAQIEPTAIDIIGGVEAPTKKEREEIFKQAETLCFWASEIGAPTIQLNGFEGLNGLSIDENIRLTAKSIRTIADIGKEFGIRFQYEGAAWTPISSLADCLRLIDAVGRDNFALVVDTWHLWASRETSPEDISNIDKKLIYNVHLSDGLRIAKGATWPDERRLRGYIIGEGKIPMAEWYEAIKSTGYDGYYSGEFLNEQLWESDHLEIAKQMLTAMQQLEKHNHGDKIWQM